jgi:hypothetical protein
MASQDLELTRYGEEGWRTTFYPAGRGHYDGRTKKERVAAWHYVLRSEYDA